MKAVILLAVLLIGVLAGFAFFHDSPVTGAAVKCSMNNHDCVCGEESCTCGDIVIRKEECYSNSNL